MEMVQLRRSLWLVFSRGGQRILLNFVANWRRFAQILSLI